METLCGYLEHVVYADPLSGFTIGKLKDPREREPIVVTGHLLGVHPGETLHCQGNWKVHPKFGRQFEIASFETKVPSDIAGIQKYLESGLVKGIGPAYAERIVEKFGIQTLEVIDNEPDRLSEVVGIGKKRIEKIKACWEEQRAVRDVMIFLRSFNISPAYAQRIYRHYGSEAIQKLKSNPYMLARDIRGIGFKMADSIAKEMGIDGNAPVRVAAGIEHVLWTLSEEGHTCYPRAALIEECHKILLVEAVDIVSQLDILTREGLTVELDGMVSVKLLHLFESGIAREIARLKSHSCSLRPILLDKAIPWVEERLKIDLAPEQQEGVACALKEKFHIITGGPGTGKSTITRAILTISEKLTDGILLAAPTGRAAKRMSEITRKKAFTIHALLEVDFTSGGFKRTRDNPLNCDLLIIDEASMIDTKLMYYLMRAIPNHARVILIGDIDQLPSVGPGNVLKDLIASDQLSVTMLKKIFRQAEGSLIIVNAHKINRGELPFLNKEQKGDFFFIEEDNPDKILETVVSLVHTRIPKKYHFHKFEQIQVLSPMKRGVIGTENLNIKLQETLNPSPSPLFRMGHRFHVGDKVMQIRNNYDKEVYNGDVGKIDTIDLTDQVMVVCFDGKQVEYEFNELDELVLAYAISIHKYQGSEAPCVIIPIHTSHFKLLYRNLLYTGITRGRKLVVLVGSKQALAMAVNNNDVLQRHTQLILAMHHSLTAPAG